MTKQGQRPKAQGRSPAEPDSVGRGHTSIHEARRRGATGSALVQPEGFLAFVKGIADTGFLVAFCNGRDRRHDWAAFHVQDVLLVLNLVNDRLVAVGFDCRDHLPQLTALAQRYADRKPDLADLCVVRMSELYPRHRVITIDRVGFRIYRRNKRETIPLICPPE